MDQFTTRLRHSLYTMRDAKDIARRNPDCLQAQEAYTSANRKVQTVLDSGRRFSQQGRMQQ